MQPQPSTGVGDPPGDMKQPVAKPLGLTMREIAGQKKRLGQKLKLLSQEHEFEPDGVCGKVTKGEVAKPRVFGGADRIFDPRAGAVSYLEGDRVAGLVCQKNLEAMSVGIGEGKLGARMGTLTATDRP
jgi:hypothetical protein